MIFVSNLLGSRNQLCSPGVQKTENFLEADNIKLCQVSFYKFIQTGVFEIALPISHWRWSQEHIVSQKADRSRGYVWTGLSYQTEMIVFSITQILIYEFDLLVLDILYSI